MGVTSTQDVTGKQLPPVTMRLCMRLWRKGGPRGFGAPFATQLRKQESKTELLAAMQRSLLAVWENAGEMLREGKR